MAPIPRPPIAPKPRIATRCTTKALRTALRQIFAVLDQKVWLVGGTALAGYYAAHRRSEDLDLFAQDPRALDDAIRAARQLVTQGAVLTNERRTPNYYHADMALLDHAFTINIVLDAHLHTIGTAHHTQDGVWVADVTTLMAMKIASLVSRCSEKDVFDLAWIDTALGPLDPQALIQAGASIDGGVTAETLLYSLSAASLRATACGFALGGKRAQASAYRRILRFRKQLVSRIFSYLQHLPISAAAQTIAAALKEQRRLK